MADKPRTFILEQPIDYARQRENFGQFLVSIGKDVEIGLGIYDEIVSFLSKPAETFMKYDVIHNRLKSFNDKLGWRVRLCVEDDGDNALFQVKAVHQDYSLLFYTEFKSIYGDVEKMRLANIAMRIASDEKDFVSCDVKATREKIHDDVYEVTIVCNCKEPEIGYSGGNAIYQLAGDVKLRLDAIPETFKGAEVDFNKRLCRVTVTLWENMTNEYSVRNIDDCMDALRVLLEEKCDSVTVDDSGLK